jgi:transcription termination factor Rho
MVRPQKKPFNRERPTNRPERTERDERPERTERQERPNNRQDRPNNRQKNNNTRPERSNNYRQRRENRPPQPKLLTIEALQDMKKAELAEILTKMEVEFTPKDLKPVLVDLIMTEQSKRSGYHMSEGILEILPDGYGFLRSSSYFQDTGDVYVSPSQIRRFKLRTGDTIFGQIRRARDGEKYAALINLDTINSVTPAESQKRKNFEKLIPLYPDEKLNLEVMGVADTSCRIMDIFSPIGKGQRGLIVAPPKAGKTTLLKNIANAISVNHPEITLIVLLIDERPEEVTDMQRSVKGEVISSTFDEPIERHTQVSKLAIEKAKRLVEMDKDVIILLDSVTRLARAYNLVMPSTGQTLSGGVNPAALYLPKKFFGAARNIENGGSLTIIATALVDTGSRLDDVIFEEFKGTGNMELILDRKLFDKRIFPCFDIMRSGTRKEELLLDKDVLQKMWILRKLLDPMSPTEVMQLLIERIGKTKLNEEFFTSMRSQGN